MRHVKALILGAAILSSVALSMFAMASTPSVAPPTSNNEDSTAAKVDGPAPSVEEAHIRARLLHETIHATLQIVHRRYYREDEGLPIPAFALKDVFEEVADRSNVELRWLVVDGEAMNVGHRPRDEFEKEAAAALASGKREYGATANGTYRYAGAITLGNDCLKCHVPGRTDTKDRTAGLVISMPVTGT